MNKEISFGIVGIVLGALIILLMSPVAPFRSMMWEGNNSGSPVSGKTAGMMNNIDEHFIEQMIPHHDGAIAMADMALTKATHPEIKILASTIIEAQNKEIVDMRAWYKSWFGKDVSKANVSIMGGGMMSGGGMHMGGLEDMQVLENATDFDKAFIEAMIPHHQLAIMMAQMLLSGTNRPEMLSLANNIIESQSKEIKEMQSWYQSWYK
ncbi:hypothetical protein A2818_00690 [Candidatus Nomurabacteria bacterium RIFCSPHIGHO2_01_FULL_40_12]|uniref:DUF305 domain-containing protein n=1 Tax=Candidatus Nomurabacteria bacterium RIFCSPHIGHO2_01_FULL_40_12 TaxID=1801737 RepID=A0A1F6V1J8_9BACT|nr:MAG: hypothetical protein A2818_00690 [Candidatus Nomurabacteria bacterium RIFCSPHIGHO2_01_FULL_40_12]